MKHSVVEMRRPERWRLKKIVQRGRERDHARHAEAMLAWWETGGNVSETARRCHASRNSVRLWEARFEAHGEAGLVPRSRGREAWKTSAQALEKLADLVRNEPLKHGYVRSRWSSALLAVELARGGVGEVHARRGSQCVSIRYGERLPEVGHFDSTPAYTGSPRQGCRGSVI